MNSTGVSCQATPSFATAEQLETRARSILPQPVYDFVAGGAGDGSTVEANVSVYDSFQFHPAVLRDVSGAQTSQVVDGCELSMPVVIAPMGGNRALHPDGELAVAAAARTVDVGYITSMGSSYSLEDVARVAPSMRWLQLYPLKDRRVLTDLVDRAATAGYRGICLTVDSPVLGTRPRVARSHGVLPAILTRDWVNLDPYGRGSPGGRSEGFFAEWVDPAFDWTDLDWFTANSRLPVVLKGIVRPEDAEQACNTGVAGIVVSNHGGRQLAGVVDTLSSLRAVASAVRERMTVLVDGGVRRASDIVIAKALGATAVGIGRPVLWALTCGGEDGVAHFLTETRRELVRVLQLLGLESFAGVEGSVVAREPLRSGFAHDV